MDRTAAEAGVKRQRIALSVGGTLNKRLRRTARGPRTGRPPLDVEAVSRGAGAGGQKHLYPGGRPRSPEETAAWLQYTLASYEQLALGYLAVLRTEDGALIGRCGLMDLVVELGEAG